MIAPQLAAFLEEGLGIHLGSRNANLEPDAARAVAVKVEDGGRHLVVYVPVAAIGRVLDDLHANGQVAVLFGRPVDDRSVQVKGTFVDVRDGREDERDMVLAQWDGYVRQLDCIGIAPALAASSATWPVAAMRVRVTALF